MTFKPHYFNLAILFFTGLILLLIVFILITIYLRNKRARQLKKWNTIADLLIRKAIFFDEQDINTGNNIPVTKRALKLLASDQHFKKLLTDKLISAKKNISGSAAKGLKLLYLQLNLHHFAVTQLASYKWHVKAQAIQELAEMEMREHIAKIYRLTNNANELVRMEAQIAVVKLLGFEGLRFLDVVRYPITEWQQIRLLHELSFIPAENFSGIAQWLKSDNKTVVAFALKLARNYHRFELYEDMCICLADPDSDVRLQAITTLGELYGDNTSDLLAGRLPIEDTKHRLALLKVLKNIATERDLPVLLKQ
ncbi:MAG: HEAT repeat domain-containing protein, partial [Mucilaginibacter sp.]